MGFVCFYFLFGVRDEIEESILRSIKTFHYHDVKQFLPFANDSLLQPTANEKPQMFKFVALIAICNYS